MDIGVNNEGAPHVPLRKLENGYVIPDVSLSTIHRRQQRKVGEKIRMGVRAEELGYDYVFQPEHHFMAMGGNSPNPVQTQTATATQTESIRLVQLANIVPWQDPVRLAEGTALLDVISDGRAEVGIGTGFGNRERETLGTHWGASSDRVKNHVAFEEAFELIESAWTDDVVSYDGHFHTVPPTYTTFKNRQEHRYFAEDVTEYEPEDFFGTRGDSMTLEALSVFPHPVQSPHPQVWRPTGSTGAAEWAAKRGINGCCYCLNFERTAELVDSYHRAAEEAGWPDHRPEYDGEPIRRGWDATRKRGIAAQIVLFNTDVADEETLERWKRGQEFLLTWKKASKPEDVAGHIEIDADRFIEETDAPIVGSTEYIVDRLRAFVDACGYEDVILVGQFDNVGLDHEEVLDQLAAFSERVVPRLEADLA